jgi:hypothetical protein
VYNPQNIIRFLLDRNKNHTVPFSPNPQNLLMEKYEITKLAGLFLKRRIARRIEELLSHRSLSIALVYPFYDTNIADLIETSRAVHDDDCTENVSNLFFTFLLYAGYVDATRLLSPVEGRLACNYFQSLNSLIC